MAPDRMVLNDRTASRSLTVREQADTRVPVHSSPGSPVCLTRTTIGDETLFIVGRKAGGGGN